MKTIYNKIGVITAKGRFAGIMVAVMISGSVLVGCKPTEKNYKTAYDVAIAKKQKTEAELDADGIVSADAPMRRIVDGDTLYFKGAALRLSPGEGELKEYNIVVSEFKMPTNARSGAAALKESGFDAFAAKSTGGRWYVVAGAVKSLDDARALILRFRDRYPSYPYIGLGSPVIIRN